jgi:hypothetical protein
MSLGDQPDLITFEVYNGHSIIGLGTALALNLDGADEATLAKLVEVAQQALSIARLESSLAAVS